MVSDAALKDNNKHTQNVKEDSYGWNASVSGIENINTNYNISYEGGRSYVTPVTIDVSLEAITREYGELTAKDYSQSANFAESMLVNGDKLDTTGAVFKATEDGAIAEGTLADPTKTSNANGNYTWTGAVTGNADFNNNYIINVGTAKSSVTKAKLDVNIGDTTIITGETPSYTGSISNPVNGDTLSSLGLGAYEVDSSVNVTEIGTYEDKIGVLIGGKVYLGGTHSDMLTNYTVRIDAGTLTVNPIPYGPDPQNPDWWDAEDKYPWYQWDKQRNERERKAEVHFVDGGMAIH